jgi:uncharacterized protein (TIGR03118 family)
MEVMKHVLLPAAAFLVCLGASAQTYTVTNIVTNTNTGVGTDPNLVNPWGLSRPSKASVGENEWWASDNATGLSTLYYVNRGGNANIAGLAITIQPAGTTGLGSPTGTAYNPANHDFAFVTLDGTLQNWVAKPPNPNPGGSGCYKCHVSTATIMVNHSGSGASYQGLTIAKDATTGADAYYVANNNGGVEAYDATSFSPVTLSPKAFTDSTIPSGYAPAGIQTIGRYIYVAYNAIAGGGTGYVDAFSTTGKLKFRLETGWFNQPWGMALAPSNFGTFSGAVLVGNTGSGWIGAYNATNGNFLGFLQSSGGDVTIPGLWGLEFGDGSGDSGPTNVLYFNAGGNSYTTGVFGAIAAN